MSQPTTTKSFPPLPTGENEPDTSKGIIAWFAGHPVAANLLMFMIILAGIFSLVANLKTTLIPKIETDTIEVQMIYPGANAGEVEEAILVRIEEILPDIKGIASFKSNARDSRATVYVKVDRNYDIGLVLDELKNQIDAINSFPVNAERPVVQKQEAEFFYLAKQIQISGDTDFISIRLLANEMKNELLALPEIETINVYGDLPYEISIEIPELTLRKYGLSLQQVANTIARSSFNLSGGTIRTDAGNILIRASGQAYRQYDFANLILISNPDGTRITLGEIANIRDDFIEFEGYVRFNGTSGIAVAVFAAPHQDILTVAEATQNYFERKKQELPEGIHIQIGNDSTGYLRDRLNLMIKNLLLGALLVFIVLTLFMHIRVAFWVMVGIPVCFLGTLAFMPIEPFDMSINIVSLFAFIMVLGLVVDDAIITGESAHRQISLYGHSVDSVVRGTRLVAVPATFGVLTTVAAFSSTFFIVSSMAEFPQAIGKLVILCLIFSLIESKLILPAHLAHSKITDSPPKTIFGRFQQSFQRALDRFISNYYRRFLSLCIDFRYTTTTTFIALLILSLGLIMGGVARFDTFPKMPSNTVTANITIDSGAPATELKRIANNLRNALYQTIEELETEYNEGPLLENVFELSLDGKSGRITGTAVAESQRSMSTEAILQQWRERAGPQPGATFLHFSAEEDHGNSGAPISFRLYGQDMYLLQKAGDELMSHLKNYNGVYDVSNSASNTVDELSLKLTPMAETLGVTLSDVASQIRNAFYGVEAQRFQRGSEEVKVMVRYPEKDRKDIATLNSMYVQTTNNAEVPLPMVAELTRQQGYQRIERFNGQRSVLVSAYTDVEQLEPRLVISDVRKKFIPDLLKRYPELTANVSGASEETTSVVTSLIMGALFSLVTIYILLAVPLRSYLQPIIIMGVIPFGCIGAIIGHIVTGEIISMMSVFGIIALSGVVVNDSLIMVNFINRARQQGEELVNATIDAGCKRFRAIMLTSLTTFLGLMPILNEDSDQAKIIIPMAISISFGILFATVITLLLVPCLYAILNDLKQLRQRLFVSADVNPT